MKQRIANVLVRYPATVYFRGISAIAAIQQ